MANLSKNIGQFKRRIIPKIVPKRSSRELEADDQLPLSPSLPSSGASSPVATATTAHLTTLLCTPPRINAVKLF